jgi:hypothetical protein
MPTSETTARPDQISVRAATAAKILDVSLRTFLRLEAEGKVTGTRISHKIKLYPVAQLRKLVGGAE